MLVGTTTYITPFRLLLDHRIQDRQQLAQASGQRDLLFFAGGQQPLIERFDHGIVASGHQRAHMQEGPNASAPTPNPAFASLAPTIPIKRGHANQRGHLLAVQVAQFRDIRQHRLRQDRPPPVPESAR